MKVLVRVRDNSGYPFAAGFTLLAYLALVPQKIGTDSLTECHEIFLFTDSMSHEGTPKKIQP
jgi:hypothetical protein